MSAPQLRLIATPAPRPAPADLSPAPARQRRIRDFGLFLMTEGVISAHGLVRALALKGRSHGDLAEILVANAIADETDLTRALADHEGLVFADPLADPPEPALIDRLGAPACLHLGLLPWKTEGGRTLVLVPKPEIFLRHRDRLAALHGDVLPVLAARPAIQAAIERARRDQLRLRAQSRTPLELSCRARNGKQIPWPLAAAALLFALAALLAPVGLFAALTLWTVISLTFVVGLKFLALFASARRQPLPPPPAIASLPVVSVIVALYKEADIAPRLVARLGRLDYPRHRLDLVLAVEEGDIDTRAALGRAALPPWMRVVVVPEGALKTKPRALNYALDFCRGSIIGVYDAEDAPEGDQILRVVTRFHQCGVEVACLQGVLDFYNPRTNWISRCFTLEYAAWFRVVLPGLQRLGMPLPLGGTTLFFRRAALERIGAWDAHNVTEDADLGIRLARHGLRTEMVDTVTGEEANCTSMTSWVKQRSRWIKGYMMTWGVHIRDPRRLWRDLGPRGFIGFQILFLGSISQALMTPVLLSYWALTFGLPHPLAGHLPAAAVFAMVGLFVICEGVNLAIGLLALRRTRHRISPFWVPVLHLYHPFAAIAAYKALWEIAVRPFYWDKTSHGIDDGAPPAS